MEFESDDGYTEEQLAEIELQVESKLNDIEIDNLELEESDYETEKYGEEAGYSDSFTSERFDDLLKSITSYLTVASQTAMETFDLSEEDLG